MTYKEIFKLAQDKGYRISFAGNISDVDIINIDDYLWGDCEESKKTHSYKALLTQSYIELALLQKWLREEYKLHIYIDTTPSFDQIHPSEWKASIKKPFSPFKWTTGHYYLGDSYEEALLKAIYETLKLI